MRSHESFVSPRSCRLHFLLPDPTNTRLRKEVTGNPFGNTNTRTANTVLRMTVRTHPNLCPFNDVRSMILYTNFIYVTYCIYHRRGSVRETN